MIDIAEDRLTLGGYYLLTLIFVFRIGSPETIATFIATLSFLGGTVVAVWVFYKQSLDRRLRMLKTMLYASLIAISISIPIFILGNYDTSTVIQAPEYVVLSAVWVGGVFAGVPMVVVHALSSLIYLKTGEKSREDIEEEILEDE